MHTPAYTNAYRHARGRAWSPTNFFHPNMTPAWNVNLVYLSSRDAPAFARHAQKCILQFARHRADAQPRAIRQMRPPIRARGATHCRIDMSASRCVCRRRPPRARQPSAAPPAAACAVPRPRMRISISRMGGGGGENGTACRHTRARPTSTHMRRPYTHACLHARVVLDIRITAYANTYRHARAARSTNAAARMRESILPCAHLQRARRAVLAGTRARAQPPVR